MRKIYSLDRYTRYVLCEMRVSVEVSGIGIEKRGEARCTLTIMKTKYHPDNDYSPFQFRFTY